MYPSLVLSAALIAPAAPVPRDTAPNTTGPAPRVLALKADASGAVRVIGTIPTKVTVTNTHFVVETVVENGQKVQKQVQKQVEQDIVTSQYFNKALADFNGKFTTADGTPLSAEEATSRVKNGATVLASADGKPIAKAWLRAVDPDTVVMTAEGLSHAQPQWGGNPLPTTPAPRLTLLGTDENGKLVAPCTSHPLNSNGGIYYGDDMVFEGRALGGRRVFKGDIYIDGYNPGGHANAKVVLKPLADVKFDAYDLNGKLVSKNETLKRLAAGGLVLVAGDSRVPDETYLKAFREDVLVLVGPELVLPVVPVDQTKKKEAKDTEKAQPAPAVQPLPAVRPGVIIRGGRAAAVPAPAAPAVAEKVEKAVEEKKAEEKKAEKK
jgi:hypothetical protein